MTNDLMHLLAVTIVIASATFFTRALPFIFFSSVETPAILSTIEKNLPPMILLLLVFYCLKDVHWFQSPYGTPELFTIMIITGLHLWKRNAMLSIFIGTGLYMFLVQYDVFSILFS